ncbi:MAG: hypothetical protein HYS07_05755 [Chlamydiae bacterium]|nr:hypothetical protein [Chlamydiota bacterium]MBI3277935.1 hypothetical protein [Chlamydiota bacterium]
MSKIYYPKHLFIEESVREAELAQTVLKNLTHLTPQYFEGQPEDFFSNISMKDGKEVLVLAEKRGRFLKPCPGSKDSLCCGYFILESQSNCNYDCTYCILQTYLNSPPLIVYTNLNDMFAELNGMFETSDKIQFRIGTGELSDSLSLDHITEFSKKLVPFFAQTQRACVELKTKSTQIENLKGLDHRRRTIVSWSLNTPRMARKEELKAASIEERLEAARLCQEWGYPLSFHLEPLLYYPEWEEDYHALIQNLFKVIHPESIAWISIGGLRLIDGLKDFAEERFPKSSFLYEELIPGTDGKLRYLKVIRLEMYRKISGWIRECGGKVPMYLCMESSDLWRKGLGYDFEHADKADEYLGENVFR